MHNKQGYILFLLFSILSICSILIYLCFSRVIVYQQLMNLTTTQQQSQQLAMSSISFAESIFTINQEKNDLEEKSAQQNSSKKDKTEDQSLEKKTLTNIFPYLNKEKKFTLTNKTDHMDATISLSIQSEHGKLNLNSLYDFENKKFINEGKPNDCKKLCVWLFERISQLTGKQNLMSAFENLLKKRESEFNDPLELLSDKDFKEQFASNIFINFEKKDEKLFLTDIFTVYTEQENINPWLFSVSWLMLLDIKVKENSTNEDIQAFLKNFKTDANWQEDWNSSLKGFYQKEYKDLPQEIKSILTTTFEANIFSLLVKTRIAETTSSIFTIVKANTKQHLTGFDILKTSQI